MLFISRREGEKFNTSSRNADDYAWVVDTDDGVETRHDLNSLFAAVMDYGIHIEGIYNIRGSSICRGGSINVYQVPEHATALQVKYRLLHGIDVAVYNGAVVNIAWNNDNFKISVIIRPSDFATRLGDSILYDMSISEEKAENNLIVALDDKIEDLSLESLRGCFVDFQSYMFSVFHVKLDLCDMTSEEKARIVYRSVGRYFEFKDCIIDEPVRYRRLRHLLERDTRCSI